MICKLLRYALLVVMALSIGIVALGGCTSNRTPIGIDEIDEQKFDVAVTGILTNSDLFKSTILGAELYFDGTVIGTANLSLALNIVTLSGTIKSVAEGQHTVSVKITRQTSSPNTYKISVSIVAEGSAGSKVTFNQPDQEKSLATGESISLTVDLR